MNTLRLTAAALGIGLIATAPVMAQQASPDQVTPEEHQQHHPEQAQPGAMPQQGVGTGMGMGIMGGQMPPMMQQMMQKMMRGGMMGSAMPCGPGQQAGTMLTPETVTKLLDAHIAMTGNSRLKVGEVARRDDGKIVASIVTRKEGAVVDKFAIDPNTHMRERLD